MKLSNYIIDNILDLDKVIDAWDYTFEVKFYFVGTYYKLRKFTGNKKFESVVIDTDTASYLMKTLNLIALNDLDFPKNITSKRKEDWGKEREKAYSRLKASQRALKKCEAEYDYYKEKLKLC